MRSKAKKILSNVEIAIQKFNKKENTKKVLKKSSLLFDLYDETDKHNILIRSAICYLLKNGSKLPKLDKSEDIKKFAQLNDKQLVNGQTFCCDDINLLPMTNN